MTDKALSSKRSIDEILNMGIDATEYERIIMARSLTGGEDVINTEMTETQAMLLAIMEAINDPKHPDGSPDDITAYDCPVLRTFNSAFKRNMISNKRKGRMEIVKVMRGEEEEDNLTSRIQRAVSGDD